MKAINDIRIKAKESGHQVEDKVGGEYDALQKIGE